MMEISKAWFWILVVGAGIGYFSVACFAILMIWFGIDELTSPRD